MRRGSEGTLLASGASSRGSGLAVEDCFLVVFTVRVCRVRHSYQLRLIRLNQAWYGDRAPLSRNDVAAFVSNIWCAGLGGVRL